MQNLVKLILGKRILTILILIFITAAGIIAYNQLKIDVFPDPSPVLVQLHCEAEGMAPEEVEKFVSYPIEISLHGLPGIKKVTSISTFGLSTVNIYFADGMDIHFARQLVAAQLPAIQEKLPQFVHAPEMGAISTGLGMVYIYALQGDIPSMELRTLQDWVVKFQLKTIPGVATVLSHGGEVKQFQVVVDPQKLIKYNIALHSVIKNIQKSSRNITAGFIEKNSEEYNIRGIGLLEDMEGLKKVMIKESGSTPVFLDQVAEIRIGKELKRGEAMLGEEKSTVSGIVMKLIGVNTAELIEQINVRMAEINKGLPPGVKMVPVYNQALIIEAAFRTVAEALLLGIILVSLILFLFIDDISSSVVSTLSIPFAMFVTFIVMRMMNMTADLMSFGGLAIGIGLLVDATVVVVENIARNREENVKKLPDRDVILASMHEVLRPLIYAMLIIILSFAPILTLQGVEGKMFRPFGFTLLIALAAAILYAVLISPVLMNMMGDRRIRIAGGLFEKIRKLYLRAFDFFYPRAKLTITIFVLIFALSVGIFLTGGSEFIPPLNEQTLMLEMVLPQGTAIAETEKTMRQIHRALMPLPEIQRVFGMIGRGESGSHSHPVNAGKSILILNGRDRWTVRSEKDLIDKIRDTARANAPGVILNFTQPIKHNLDSLITGVMADLAIKIYGPDVNTLIALSDQVKRIMTSIPGVEDIQATRISGQNEVSVRLNRERLARVGAQPEDVLEELEAAVGGKSIAKMYQGDFVYDIFVRYSEGFRKDIRDLGNILVNTEKGGMIPLASVAEIEEAPGLGNIERENGKRYITVQCNVRGRDIGGVVAESKEKIYKQANFPLGYYPTWGGQFELKQRAENRLLMVMLITFLLIVLLLFDFLKSWKDILTILVTLPVSMSGGVISLWLAGSYLSAPSTIGFLALLGIALENTLILISFFKSGVCGAADFDGAVRENVGLRLRAVLMTKFTTIIGLIPLLFSAGIGSEIQRPLAIVVVGGIIFSIFTTMLLMPVVFRMFYYKKPEAICEM